eukprot:scaffold114398_cov67-Phaeocystis_antarctica.AAC.2
MSTGTPSSVNCSMETAHITQTAHSSSGLTLAPASLLSSDDTISWLVTMQLQAIKEQLSHPSLTQEERLRLFSRAAVLARRGISHAPPAPLSSRSASGKRVALNPHLDPSPHPSPEPPPFHLQASASLWRPLVHGPLEEHRGAWRRSSGPGSTSLRLRSQCAHRLPSKPHPRG